MNQLLQMDLVFHSVSFVVSGVETPPFPVSISAGVASGRVRIESSRCVGVPWNSLEHLQEKVETI